MAENITSKLMLSNEQLNKITKDKIRGALRTLMHEKSFKNVTITELVKKAGVSRTAFYRNYESKEAILEEICESFTGSIKGFLSDITKNVDLYNLFLDIFVKMKEAEEEIKLLFKAHLHIEDLFPTEIGRFFRGHSANERYVIIGLYGACKAIISDWIKNGMSEPIEEMASLCYNLCKNKII